METDFSAPLLPDDRSVRRAWLRLLIVVIVLICLAGVLVKRAPQVEPAPHRPGPLIVPEAPLPRAIRCRSAELPLDEGAVPGCRRLRAVPAVPTG